MASSALENKKSAGIYAGLKFYFAPPHPDSEQLLEIKRRVVNLGATISSDAAHESCFNVFTSFSGELFQKLQADPRKRYRIIGWQYLVSVLENNQLPKLDEDMTPKFSDVLEGHSFCFTQIEPKEKAKLRNLACYMSAEARNEMTTATTHLICGSASTAKYATSVEYKIPTLTPAYIIDSWKSSRAMDEADYYFPPFHELVICSASLPKNERHTFQQTVQKLGGTYQPIFTAEVTHLVTNDTECKKYQGALQTKTIVVTPQWVEDCAKRKVRLPVEGYSPAKKNTTTTDEEVEKRKNQSDQSDALSHVSASSVSVPENSSKKKVEEDTNFLSSCMIALKGFAEAEEEKLRKSIETFGATLHSEPAASTTHIIAAHAIIAKRLLESHTCDIVMPSWLQESVRQRRALPITADFRWRNETNAASSSSGGSTGNIMSGKKKQAVPSSSPKRIDASTDDADKKRKKEEESAEDSVILISPKASRKSGSSISSSKQLSVPEVDNQMPSTSPDRDLENNNNNKKKQKKKRKEEGELVAVVEEKHSVETMNFLGKTMLFLGKIFFAKGFQPEEITLLDEVLTAHSGVLFPARDSSDVPAQFTHYIIRPHGEVLDENDLTIASSSSVVSSNWIEACVSKGEVLDPDSNLVYRPMPHVVPIAKFEKLRIAFAEYDLSIVDTWAYTLRCLGSKVFFSSEKSIRSRCNLLIAPNDEFTSTGSDRIKWALTHRVPIVTTEWIRQSAIVGYPLPPGSFLQFSHSAALPPPIVPRVMCTNQTTAVGTETSSVPLQRSSSSKTKIFEGKKVPKKSKTILNIDQLAYDLFKKPLENVTIYVSKYAQEREKGPNEQKYLLLKAESLGASYVYTFTTVVTHIIHTGKPTTLQRDVSAQKLSGRILVSPLWIHACFDRQKRLPESEFPPQMNPHMTLSWSSSQPKAPVVVNSNNGVGGGAVSLSRATSTESVVQQDLPSVPTHSSPKKEELIVTVEKKAESPIKKASALKNIRKTKAPTTPAEESEVPIAKAPKPTTAAENPATEKEPKDIVQKKKKKKKKKQKSAADVSITASPNSKKQKVTLNPIVVRTDDEESLPRTPAPPKVLVLPTSSSPVIVGSSLSLPASDTTNQTDLLPQQQQQHLDFSTTTTTTSNDAMVKTIPHDSIAPVAPPTPQVIHDAKKFLSVFQKAESALCIAVPGNPIVPGKAITSARQSTDLLSSSRLQQQLRLEEFADSLSSSRTATNSTTAMGNANVGSSSSLLKKKKQQHSKPSSDDEEAEREEEEDYADEFLTGQTQTRVGYERLSSPAAAAAVLLSKKGEKDSPIKIKHDPQLQAKIAQQFEDILYGGGAKGENLNTNTTTAEKQAVPNQQQKTPQKKTTPPKQRMFVLSSIQEECKPALEKRITTLGGTILKDQSYHPDLTHVILGVPNRALKSLCAIATGTWMLREKYIHECTRQNKWLDESEFVWRAEDVKPTPSEDEAERQQKLGLIRAWHYWRDYLKGQSDRIQRLLHKSNLTASSCLLDPTRNGVFSNWRVLVLNDRKGDDQSVVQLLKAAGAYVFLSPKEFLNAPKFSGLPQFCVLVEQSSDHPGGLRPESKNIPTVLELRKRNVNIVKVDYLLEYIESCDRHPEQEHYLTEFDENFLLQTPTTLTAIAAANMTPSKSATSKIMAKGK